MSDSPKIMRSQLGRARGLGSAKTGTEHWWVQRVTSLALIPLTLWFLFSLLGMLGADQPTVAAWAARPLNAALLLALILMSFHHAQLGLQVVYEDYVHGALRTASILATKGAALLLGLMAALAVIKLFLAAH
jgi:succinate dehydrogenase / fumarate reductase, membrane anchor subunit